MKAIKTLLIFFTLSFVYGQNQTTQNNNIVEKRTFELSDSITILKLQIQVLKEREEWKNEVLNERIQQASDTISNQNSLLSGFGVLYTIITIVIALIGVALPVLTYQFGIKPSQDALKEFEENADKKMEGYLEKSRNKQIEQAIENIKSQNSELLNNAITFLSLTQHQGFSDEQLYKLFILLKSDNIDQTSKATIAFSISNRKSEYATEYFTLALSDTKSFNLKYSAIRYFANIGIEGHLDIFRNLVSNSTEKHTELITIMSYLHSTNKNALLTIINDKELIDKLDDKALKILKGSFPSLKKSWQLTDNETDYLNKKIDNTSS